MQREATEAECVELRVADAGSPPPSFAQAPGTPHPHCLFVLSPVPFHFRWRLQAGGSGVSGHTFGQDSSSSIVGSQWPSWLPRVMPSDDPITTPISFWVIWEYVACLIGSQGIARRSGTGRRLRRFIFSFRVLSPICDWALGVEALGVAELSAGTGRITRTPGRRART